MKVTKIVQNTHFMKFLRFLENDNMWPQIDFVN